MKEEMTANELADKCNRLQGEIILGFLADCATMLRQQQAEIESLGKAFEGERKYARYLSKLCIDNKIPIVWSF
jgi:hypothetical protein